MEALIALLAVFFGWLLGFGQQAWRDRREAQYAARLLIHELGINAAELDSRARSDWRENKPISHRVWEAYGVIVLRIIPYKVMHKILLAQISLDHADKVSTFIATARQRFEKHLFSRGQALDTLADMEERAKLAVAEARERVDEATFLLIRPAHENIAQFLVRRLFTRRTKTLRPAKS
jgi:hypothetical protein